MEKYSEHKTKQLIHWNLPECKTAYLGRQEKAICKNEKKSFGLWLEPSPPLLCVVHGGMCEWHSPGDVCTGMREHVLSTFAHITTSRDLPVTHFLVDGKFCTGSYLRTAALNKTDFDIQDRKLPPKSLQLHSSKVKERAQAEGLLRPGPSWLRH